MFIFGFICGFLGGVALMAIVEIPEKWIYSENDDREGQ
jgi:hypothetical protein